MMATAAVILALAGIVAWCAFTAGRLAERQDREHQRTLGARLHPSQGGANVVDQGPGERVRRIPRGDAPPYDYDAEGD